MGLTKTIIHPETDEGEIRRDGDKGTSHVGTGSGGIFPHGGELDGGTTL